MAILVTGGAGYIGSHTVSELLDKGEEVVVYDNLSTGHEESLKNLGKLIYIKGSLQDKELLTSVFQSFNIIEVIHFASSSLVGVSVNNPLDYYENNVNGTLCLLKIMNKFGVKKIVFSSTAATYGEPKNIPILETEATLPTNPYGETKLAIEKMLKWCDEAYGMKYVVLRYFNVAGAHIEGKLGEDHRPETHLIPIILQVALNQRDNIMIYGDDYDTPDGTCIRDYIHVTDLANAHILALEKLRKDNTNGIYNLGSGNGFSVKEVIDVARKVTKHPIPTQIVTRRAGDPAILIASSQKAIDELGWNPQYTNLDTMIETAWNWFKNNPNGYIK